MDLRRGDTLLDTADRHRAYYVEALDQPSIGYATLYRFDPTDAAAYSRVVTPTGTLLRLLAEQRLILAGRQAA